MFLDVMSLFCFSEETVQYSWLQSGWVWWLSSITLWWSSHSISTESPQFSSVCFSFQHHFFVVFWHFQIVPRYLICPASPPAFSFVVSSFTMFCLPQSIHFFLSPSVFCTLNPFPLRPSVSHFQHLSFPHGVPGLLYQSSQEAVVWDIPVFAVIDYRLSCFIEALLSCKITGGLLFPIWNPIYWWHLFRNDLLWVCLPETRTVISPSRVILPLL